MIAKVIHYSSYLILIHKWKNQLMIIHIYFPHSFISIYCGMIPQIPILHAILYFQYLWFQTFYLGMSIANLCIIIHYISVITNSIAQDVTHIANLLVYYERIYHHARNISGDPAKSFEYHGNHIAAFTALWYFCTIATPIFLQ